MCKVKKTYPLWGFLLSFPLWTVSCVDNKYDLDKDIDMTVNVGGEHLTIPAGSSDTAYLSKIIEVEEGDILQPDAATRVYHLTKKDDIDVKPTTVKEVTISETTTNLSPTEIVNATSSSVEVPATVTTFGDFEAKSRIKAQQFQENDNVLYNFDDSGSLYDIKEFIMGFSRINEVSLIIIDCLANLYEFSDVDNFSENYAMIKEFRDFIVNKNLCCVLTHHTKKGKAKLQDSVLGSKSLTSATTGTIIIETENEFSTTGTLNFILRSRKEKIPIKKDDYNINWVFNDSDDGDEFIDPNVLLIIKALAINESHCMKDNCQTLTAKMNLTINPKGLYRFLVKNKTILDENHIYFSKERNGHERLIKLEFSPEK